MSGQSDEDERVENIRRAQVGRWKRQDVETKAAWLLGFDARYATDFAKTQLRCHMCNIAGVWFAEAKVLPR